MKTLSEKFRRQRSFLLALPLLTLPFTTMLFWALGGGPGIPTQVQAQPSNGLNLSLPDARFGEEETWDKLALYERADRDSAKYAEARESDPYFDLIAFRTQSQTQTPVTADDNSRLIDSFPRKSHVVSDPNEAKVTEKLNELYREMNRTPTPAPEYKANPVASPSSSEEVQWTENIDRMEQMMEQMKRGDNQDPEMQQIEAMLEKILDIQHPERVAERHQSQRRTQQSLSHTVVPATDTNVSLLSSKHPATTLQTADSSVTQTAPADGAAMTAGIPLVATNGFFGLDEEQATSQSGNSLEAVIHDTQELVAGATVKLRLLTALHINGVTIPRDQLVYGTCALNAERLSIQITSIRTGNAVLPVALTVYDLDGLEGIYIPGAITRDAAKQASDDALQNVQLMSMNPSIGAQAAIAGVEAAKGLFSKKAKTIRVTVKAGYQVFLVDTNPSATTF